MKEVNVKAKLVDTGINRYLEFDSKLEGFKDGKILIYRTCQDGKSVIVKR